MAATEMNKGLKWTIAFLSHWRRRHCFKFFLAMALFMLFSIYCTMEVYSNVQVYLDQGSENNIRLYRDVYSQDPWPSLDILKHMNQQQQFSPSTSGSVNSKNNINNFETGKDDLKSNFRPGDLPGVAHYFWCGQNEVFKFEDYLGILSIVRIFKSQKIIFHYNSLPIIDSYWYHTWFQELKQSVPNLVLNQVITKNYRCGSIDILKFGLKRISLKGGIFIGRRTILSRVPKEMWSSGVYYAFVPKSESNSIDDTQGVFYSKTGFSSDRIDSIANEISDKIVQFHLLDSPKMEDGFSLNVCLTANLDMVKNRSEIRLPEWSMPEIEKSVCIVMTSSIYPKNIWDSETAFGELCRWLYYGKRSRFQVKPDPDTVPLIPMISHIVWMKAKNIFKSNEFKFLHYLSILSSLHVGGFEHVYIHGELEPFGEWWNTLMAQHRKNITFVKTEQPETIFQQEVVGPSHQSDILRLNILLKYGGVYHDRDVIWVSKVPRDVRRYQTVACFDWPINGAWPEVFNMGVMMAKPGAQWLRHFLQTFSYYRDDKWAFNAVMMPYKSYEMFPDTLYVDRYLQVICFKGVCHPAWHDDYIRDIDDLSPVQKFDWRDARAFHFTVPKPPESLSSPDAIAKGNDMYAEMGKMILQKAGRKDLLET